MLFIVIISVLSSILTQNCVNSVIPIDHDPRDLLNKVSDTFNNAVNEFEDVVKKIPDLPIIGEAVKFAECTIAAGKSTLNPSSTAINDATIAIKNKLTEIQECKSSIINAIRSIISQNNKDSYLDLAKGYFDKCTGLNAGAITIEQGAGGNMFVGGSAARGLAIDTTNGNVYAYTAACAGFASDVTADGGFTLSLFEKFSDVAGCSKYYAVGFDVNIVGVEAGMDVIAVYNVPSDSIIARGIGYGVGVGGNPQSVENGYCYTFNPIKMIDLNEFKQNDMINTIPALLTYIPQTPRLQAGKLVRFVCAEIPTHPSSSISINHYMYHKDFRLYCGEFPGHNNDLFTVRNALNGKSGQFSFESVNFPSYYIRHTERQFRIDYVNDITNSNRDDASFIAYNGLTNNQREQSFETSTDGYKYHFMRAANDGAIWLDIWEDSSDYKEDISFWVY